ncbi:MAG: hypothetical protein GY851_02815 [bacterium]|nr:hypothetical protein [bacterium]
MQRQRTILVPVMQYGRAAIAVGLTLYFVLVPAIFVWRNIVDPALKTGDIPREAWRLHRYLTPRYEKWARARIASRKAADVHYLDVPATEWPLYGCVFYLWGTEHLQAAYEKDPSLAREAPVESAHDTIEACKDLLLDPVHHTWVKTHWGDDYMHEQNVFFRSLIIAGLTSYERLVGTGEYIPLLRDQADTLAAELDASPYGVLDDYPGECYPIDVFAAVAWLRRSDAVTGADHSAFVARQLRAFQGDRLDDRGMIPWLVHPWSGEQLEASRGILNSHILIFADEIYPAEGRIWYDLYEEHFWQETWYAAGYREYYRDRPGSEWTYDVDAGPIIGGFSPSANAFGIAAARVNGRFDQAYTLSAQVLAVSWPLPDGRLVGTRFLSDRNNAPYLGETALLWQLAEPPADGMDIVQGGHLPGAIYLGFAIAFAATALVFLAVYWRFRRWRRRESESRLLAPRIQFTLWATAVVLAPVLLLTNGLTLAVLALLATQFFPVVRGEPKAS